MADESSDTPPAPGDPDHHFLGLVLRYFDGDLSDDETRELNEQLRNAPDRRRQFADYCAHGCLIRETFTPERETARDAGELAPGRQREGNAQGRRKRVRAVVAAVVVLAVAVLWLSRPSGRRGVDSAVGALGEVSGDVSVTTSDGQVQPVFSAVLIRSGDTIRSQGPQSTASLVYADGTRVMLVGETSLTCDDRTGKHVVVHQGTLAASVRPQPPGRPLVLETPAARVEVLGTQFLVEALPHQTDLSVTEGCVRLIRIKDGKEIDVPKGKRLKAAEGSALAVEDIPRPPDTWGLDFEDGLPGDFRRGTFTEKGLPRGSKGAVAAKRADHGKEGVVFEVATPDMWYGGLFTVHPDSHFHFTFKMERPDWVNVFLIARGLGPRGAYSVNYLFDQLRFWPPQPGQWRTVSIPISQFGKPGVGPGRLSANEVPYLILFSSGGDRGLAIDRMWITRGGPGEVKYADVP